MSAVGVGVTDIAIDRIIELNMYFSFNYLLVISG
jgi:hypothetical protein